MLSMSWLVVIPSDEARKMIVSKMKLLGATVCLLAVGSAALAWVHRGAETADPGNGTNYVLGQDGELISAAPNPSVRSQWQREGLPN